jgi:hypothetical protein
VAHDVFISYSSKDKSIADAVCARLEGHGVRCWIAPRDVQPGLPYAEEIIDAIHHCRAMVLVLSANANASPHIPKEIERAVSNGIPVIPLRVENVMPAKSLDYFISSVHWLDAITPPLDQHLESLARTIQTLLPDSPRVVAPHAPVPQPQATAGVPAAPPSAAAKRPVWIFSAVAIGLVALIGAGWFFWSRSSDSAGNAPPNGFVNSTLPAVRPATPRTTPASSAADPMIGCWHWFNNVEVAIRPDGTMNAGPIAAHWRLADSGRRIYHFTWPEAVDTVVLSADGRTISGGNQYGIPMTATRLSAGPAIAGFWRWYNGAVVTIRPDGMFNVGSITGRWAQTPQGTFTLTWPDPVDTVTLSSDRQRLNGSNQYGFRITATKIGACGS